MLKRIVGLLEYRELLFMITWREVRVRYKQSVMGCLWALIMPMVIVAAGTLIRWIYAQASGNPLASEQVIGVAIKAVPWAFFIGSVRFATISLTANPTLVTKIYFPKDIFPISAVCAQLVDLFVSTIALAVLLVAAQIPLAWSALWAPVLLLILVALAAGLGIILSAANLFFRDVKYLVEVFVTFGIFVTPVFYEVGMLGDWGWLMMLNPVAPLLEGLYSCLILGQAPDLIWVGYSASCATAMVAASLSVFEMVEPQFAERI